jgi:peptide/nickel transport system substrate-binding protein
LDEAKTRLIAGSFLLFFSLGVPSPAFPEPPRKTLVIAVAAEPKSFNELIAQETTTTQVTGFLFEGLTRLNTETGKIEGRLAEGWESDADGLSWTFHLRRDVSWFDGRPFTSGDVVFTYRDLIYNPRVVTPAKDVFTLDGRGIEVTAPDPHTVVFKLPRRFAPLLLALTQSIYPRHVLEKSLENDRFQSTWGVDTPPAEIVGTGPFKLSVYRPGERIELVKNGNYWRKTAGGKRLPHLEKIIMIIVPSPDGRLLKFLEGETDVYQLTGGDFPLLSPRQGRGRFKLWDLGPATGSNFLAFNQGVENPVKRKWFRSLAFRKAVAHALDRGAMIDIIYNGLGEEQCSPLSPSNPVFYNSSVPCYESDPDRSGELLRRVGFADRDGDGFLEDGEGHAVEFLLVTNTENPDRLQMAGMVREDLAKIGIRAHLQPIEFNSLVTKLVASHDWDALILGLTGEVDPHFGANVWKSTGSLHFWNPGAKDPPPEWETRVDRIFEDAVGTLDPEARGALYDEWQNTVARELPMIYTVLPKVVYAIRDRFKNVRPTVLGGPFQNIEWIETGE